MRLEGCVRRDIMMDLERPHAYCMFISIRLLHLEMMSADAHRTMSANAHRCKSTQMRVFMRCMTLWGSADLQTSLQISLTRGSRDVRAPWGLTLARVSRV